MKGSIPTVSPVNIKKSEDEVEAEFFFAIDLFLSELHDIRKVIQMEWTAYKEGKQDMVVASLMTNTAIDLVRQAERDFGDTFVRPARFPASRFPVWTLAALRYSCQAKMFGDLSIQEMEKHVKPSGTLLGLNMSNCEFCFYPVYSGLKALLYATQYGDLYPEVPLDQFGKGPHPPDLGRTIKMASIYQFAVQTYLMDYVTQDEVSRGMRFLLQEPRAAGEKKEAAAGVKKPTQKNETGIEDRVIPLWVTFGMQALLDVQGLLGDDMDLSFHELQTLVEALLAPDPPLGDAFTYTEEERRQKDRSDEDSKSACTFITQSLQRAVRDDVYSPALSRTELIKKHSILSKVAVSRFFFLKRQPILCGYMKYHAFSNELNYRLELERNREEMCWMAYLYAAAQTVVPRMRTWPDMEFVLQRQDPAWFFHGGKPTDIENAEIKLFLACGSSAKNSAINQRQKTKQNREQLGTISPEQVNLNNVRRFGMPNKCMMDIFFIELSTPPDHTPLRTSTHQQTLSFRHWSEL
ncbi:hypothetical protein BDV96DRAFT_340413 [Lophiotrema nucula]|uniref:DUF6604 domain-containing protein n=1 Tax=Lophiotrema nucula TaxID=690887 RepID=A0A6A5YFW4_9PLEO|nr:hypothetical protein BDV96DRAFT_340413 [Lophiotrema nucula]